MKRTQFDLDLGCAKDGAPHSESFDTSETPSRTKRSTSFLKISLCIFGTGYGNEHISLKSSLNQKSTGSVFQVQNVPSNNSSNLCTNFSNLLRCVVVRC